MPAEPRRNSRKLTSDDDIELKRARGEISCAECRRLKLKCDKKIPCGSCVRRGCTSICPNGSLSAGQGTRFILADTEQLHRKISEMSERIRQLEDALAIFQAGISHERHPLLRDELLTIKFGPEVRRTVDDEHQRDMLSASIDALGTLTVGEHGESKYFGRSAGSETMLAQAVSADEEGSPVPSIEPELANLAIAFPVSIIEEGTDALMLKLEAHLPPQPRAWALCETYLEHLTWWCRPIKRDELINDILIPIYNCKKDPSKNVYHRDGTTDEEGRCPHLLSVLFFVFALGSLVDLTLPPCSAEAELYYRLGRAALSLRSIFDSQEIETVQALIHMAMYHSLCSQRWSLESAWRIISLSGKIAQSLGLHRDSAAWKLSDKAVQRRRNLFWELFSLEMIHCMSLGRPPALTFSHIDCELPTDEDATVDDGDGGSNLRGYWSFKHSFTRDVYTTVVDGVLAAKPPSYAKVLEYDRQIRQTTLPNVRLYLRPDEANYSNPSVVLRSFFLSHFRSITMIHIHRTFFAQALLDNPTNPLSSPYAPSFLAANRCASILLRSFLHHWNRSPEICSRFWGMWTHAFSAAVILGSTVTRSPNATMAPSALTDLDLAVDFFERGAQLSPRARQALPILKNLKERALRAFNEYRNRHMTPSLDIQLRIGPEDQFQDELAIFGGQTRVVTNKFLSRHKNRIPTKPRIGVNGGADTPVSPSQATTPAPTSVASPQSASTPSEDGGPLPPQVEDQMEDVHPSLMEYLSLFPSAASISVVNGQQQQPMDTTPSVFSPAALGSSPFTNMRTPSSAAGVPGLRHQPQPQPQSQPQAGPSTPTGRGTEPVGDPLAFFNVLPDSGAVAAGLPDPSLVFAAMGMGQPDMGPLGTNIFGSSFGGGDFGDQWTSLMRETGFFDAQGNFKTDGLMSPMSPTTPGMGQQGHARRDSGDIYPTY
ncbi:fungal-specific transcription factor domain-containing protein [Dichomitus squalens]|uniref:Fungal-specific transcription factor domain-containing protein n=1 Tax=Dichomitus squalens TaxID=114155 RepID=A0A4Q9ME93_9APHY|nr:fungal-specific transcription factor domain-containing protein [Dichomitus squalens]